MIKLRCKKCNYKNPIQAKYCYSCGNRFEQKEKENSMNRGFVGFLKKARNWYDTLTLSKITSKLWFRCLSVLLVILIGVLGLIKNGYHLKIQDSIEYTYQYNKKLDEYYLYTKALKSKVNLYAWGNNEKMILEYYDEKDNLINKKELNIEDIVLEANTVENNYYVLKNKIDQIKIYVYQKK